MKSRSALLLLAWIFFLFVLQCSAIDDADVLSQIRLGQLAVYYRQLVDWEPFLYTNPTGPIVNPGWLSQIIFYLIVHLAGWHFLVLFKALCYSTAFVLAANMAAAEVTGLPLLSAAALGFLSALSNSTMRAQCMAALCFALIYMLAARLAVPGDARARRNIWLQAAAIAIFWQNVHPSLPVGIVMTATLTAAALIGGDRPATGRLAVLTGILALAQLATPLTTGIFTVSRLNQYISRQVIGVSEWQPPWHPAVYDAMWPFWFAFLLTAVLLIRSFERVRPRDLLLCLVFSALTLYSARFALFWSIIMIPIWAEWLEIWRPADAFVFPLDPSTDVASLLLGGVAGTAVSMALASFFVSPIGDAQLPIKGVAALQQYIEDDAQIYNFREWAGPLVAFGNPNWKIAIDGRLYLFPEYAWKDYESAGNGELPLEKVMALNRPDAFFLHPVYQQGLVKLLSADPEWRRVYIDSYCVVFVHQVG